MKTRSKKEKVASENLAGDNWAIVCFIYGFHVIFYFISLMGMFDDP